MSASSSASCDSFFPHFDKTPLQSCARLLQLKRPPRGLVCTSTPSYFDHWVLVIAEWHSSTCDVFWNGNYMMRQFYRYVHTTLHSTLFNAELLRSPSPYPTAPLPRRSVVKFGIYLLSNVTFCLKHYWRHWNNGHTLPRIEPRTIGTQSDHLNIVLMTLTSAEQCYIHVLLIGITT